MTTRPELSLKLGAILSAEHADDPDVRHFASFCDGLLQSAVQRAAKDNHPNWVNHHLENHRHKGKAPDYSPVDVNLILDALKEITAGRRGKYANKTIDRVGLRPEHVDQLRTMENESGPIVNF